ncbi:MAG: hypothetical protein ACU0CF_04625 [Sagittula sp.]|uniref:hypothetical protein n=1 Tax=Sagittula sp. TaxID=2038081 RepID=UPI00405A3610
MSIDITPAPTLPSLSDPANFNSRALALFSWMTNTFISELEDISASDLLNALLDGSAASPSLAFASDPDTGFYRAGANQLAFTEGGTDRGRLYGRKNILGPVGQSCGVPTGALIERDFNSNGIYTRFTDGMQICTTLLTGVTSDEVAGSVFRSSADSTWTFPATFLATPAVFGHCGNGSSWVVPSGNSPTIAQIRRYTYTSDGTGRSLFVSATGRWI